MHIEQPPQPEKRPIANHENPEIPLPAHCTLGAVSNED
jgi:hypothetical protein